MAIAGGHVVERSSQDLADAPVLDASGMVVAPGFLDLRVNGAGGIDVTAEPERRDRPRPSRGRCEPRPIGGRARSPPPSALVRDPGHAARG
jgi:formylmethanofuran dehydrogenase subunit A